MFEDVTLNSGNNWVTASGFYDGKESAADSVRWRFKSGGEVNIAAGRLATGYVSSAGERFGSDNFFSGGTFDQIEVDGAIGPENLQRKSAKVGGTEDPQLYKTFRRGDFGYNIPLRDDKYEVTLGFVEPSVDIQTGGRVFDVSANGEKLLEDFDILEEAGTDRNVVTKTFTVTVTEGALELEFTPTGAQDAVVSTIRIQRL